MPRQINPSGSLFAALACLFFLLPIIAGKQQAIASQTAQQIEVGAYVDDISNIDITTGNATFDLYLWIVSSEPFDASNGFEIINGDGSARVVESKTREDGKAYQLLRVSATTKQRYDLKHYPFDNQRLELKFDFDPSVEDTNIRVVADDTHSELAKDIILPGWQVDGFFVGAKRANYLTSWGDIIQDASQMSYPQFTVRVQIERETAVYLVRYFSVIIFAGLLAMLGLFLKPSETTRISLGIGAYISLSASNLVIANKLPITDSLNFSDHIILVTGAVILATVLYSMTTYHLYSRTPARAETVDRIARIGFPLVWLVSLVIVFVS